MRKRILIALGLLLVVVGGVAAVLVVREEPAPPVIRGSASVEFETTREPPPPTTTEEAEPEEEPAEEPREIAEPWPTYGYDLARTHVSPYDHRPPFRRLWEFGTRNIIEFPPTVAYGRVYVAQIRGHLWALDSKTGKVVWHRDFGRCQAASPTVTDGLVYQPLLPRDCNTRGSPGMMVALDADTGKTVWAFRGPATESTALVVNRTVYFGAWDHRLYALDARTGKLRWSFEADDELNGAPAYGYGMVYVGSDGGRLYAVSARTGRQQWRAEAIRREYFYATPAVAYGRVYIGNTDGTVYAFGARTGNLLWTQRAGTYVYTAAAVWNRTVYVGSYDGNVYAFDAATGDLRWRRDSHGSIHGAPTVMAGLVYFANCGKCGRHGVRSTERGPPRMFALDARTGREVWSFSNGRYSPVVADEKRVYLVGVSRVYAREPCKHNGRPRC